MDLEMLIDWNKRVSTPEELFWAMFTIGMIFIFLIGLYPAILIFGQLELKDERRKKLATIKK